MNSLRKKITFPWRALFGVKRVNCPCTVYLRSINLVKRVPELFADLVDPVDASDDEHLVIQLGCHPHKQIHVQVVVMRHEGLGRGTTLTVYMPIQRLNKVVIFFIKD